MEEIEGRVTALEQQMRSVRQDAAAARVLAGGADRDVATLTARMDAQTRLMEALRQTQVEDHAVIAELRRDVAGLKGDVGGLRDDVGGLKADMAEVKGDIGEFKVGFVNLARGQEVIVELLRRRNGHE
jgi:chromosome segregation ATPase